jgi:CubicO group peptidase (beta-lactamase class C family)
MHGHAGVARILSICFSVVTLLGAETDRAKDIDAVFTNWNKPDSPGAAVAVIEHGKTVYEKGYGSANLEYSILIGPETIFHVASVSKQFTAMSIVLLERDGKLSIDDEVHKYLPELPRYDSPITLRNLLQHTSGIRDQWQTLATAGWSLEDVITQDQILRMLFRQKELNFAPGSRYLYSNSGFTLLAEIVRRVSGKPLPEFCEERIFGPLGMTHTHFHLDLHRIVPKRAYSYSPAQSGGFENAPLNYANVGATSLFTTAGDLVKWLDNFRDPKVGGPAAIARMQEQCVLTDGKKADYALGIVPGMYRGLKTISHNGADAGFRSAVIWFPDQELGVAVLSNLGSFNPSQAANKVAEVFLAGKMTAPPAQPQPVTRTFITLEPAALQAFAGTYPLPAIGQTLDTAVDQGKLWAVMPDKSRLEMKAVGPAHFYLAELRADIEFTTQPNGGMNAKITQPGAVNTGDRVASAAPVKPDLNAYAGVYWSEELEAEYAILARDGRLYASNSHHGEFELTATTKDKFRSPKFFFQDVTFVRNSQDRVTALTVGGGRVTAIRFDRKQTP